MSHTRVFRTLSTAASFTIRATVLITHVLAYYDRMREQDDDDFHADHLRLTFLSQMLATGHTLATLFEIAKNYNRAGIEMGKSKPKYFTGTCILGSVATLTAAWASSHSEASLVCSIANSGWNFFGKLSSAMHRKAVLNEMKVDFVAAKHGVNPYLDLQEESLVHEVSYTSERSVSASAVNSHVAYDTTLEDDAGASHVPYNRL